MKTMFHIPMPKDPYGRVAIADIVEIEPAKTQGFSVTRAEWILTRINVPQDFQRQGYGTRLMKMVCEEADKHDIVLVVCAVPYRPAEMSTTTLIRWYERFGFVQTSGPGSTRGILKREPQKNTKKDGRNFCKRTRRKAK